MLQVGASTLIEVSWHNLPVLQGDRQKCYTRRIQSHAHHGRGVAVLWGPTGRRPHAETTAIFFCVLDGPRCCPFRTDQERSAPPRLLRTCRKTHTPHSEKKHNTLCLASSSGNILISNLHFVSWKLINNGDCTRQFPKLAVSGSIGQLNELLKLAALHAFIRQYETGKLHLLWVQKICSKQGNEKSMHWEYQNWCLTFPFHTAAVIEEHAAQLIGSDASNSVVCFEGVQYNASFLQVATINLKHTRLLACTRSQVLRVVKPGSVIYIVILCSAEDDATVKWELRLQHHIILLRLRGLAPTNLLSCWRWTSRSTPQLEGLIQHCTTHCSNGDKQLSASPKPHNGMCDASTTHYMIN